MSLSARRRRRMTAPACIVVLGIMALAIGCVASNPLPLYVDALVETVSEVDGVKQEFKATFTLIIHYPSNMRVADVPQVASSSDFVGPLKKEDVALFRSRLLEIEFGNSEDTTELPGSYFLTRGQMPALAENASVVNRLDGSPTILQSLPSDLVWVVEFRKFAGTFATKMDLRDFPYDNQKLPITVRASSPHVDVALVYNPVPIFVLQIVRKPVEYKLLGGEVTPGHFIALSAEVAFTQVTFNINVERLPAYYVNKIIVGIMFVVAMSWSSYLIQDSNRMAVTGTLFLAVVTYLFLVNSDVPKVPYSTRLDSFILWSMSNIFVTYAYHSIAAFGLYYTTGKQRQWEKAIMTQRKAEAKSAAMHDLAEAASQKSTKDDVDFDTFAERDPRWFHMVLDTGRFIIDISAMVVVILHYVIGSSIYLRV